MTNAVSKNLNVGAQGEYLAQYLLSSIGLPLPVLRQVDIGIDFYCNVSTDSKNLYTFSHPFSVQIKKLNDQDELSESISYGGFSKSGRWKNYEIEWLFNPGVPFYIGIVDINKRSLLLYATSAIWFVYHQHNTPTCVTLLPRIYSHNTDKVHSPKQEKLDCSDMVGECGDGFEYFVDIGHPILQLDINNIDDVDYINSQKEILRNYIDSVDQRNITQRVLGTPFFWWNKDLPKLERAWYVNPWSPNLQVDKILEELVPPITSLALFYKNNGAHQELVKLIGTLSLISGLIPDEIKSGPLKEIFDLLKQSDSTNRTSANTA